MLHNFRVNYLARSESYVLDMKELFKTIPQNVDKTLTSREENQELITYIGGGCYLENVLRDYHH